MSTKTKDELLLEFRRANKKRRPAILKREGFAMEADYLAYLMAPDATEAKEEVEEGMLDQVIAFDTTGSMSSYIGAVRRHVKELIPQIFEKNKNVRIKIVAFGDYCDMIDKNRFGKAYQEIELTNNQNALIDFVQNAQNTSGGDGDEFYELVIKKIVEETKWRDGATKAVLLIADYNPHEVGYSYSDYVRNNQIDWREEARKSAAKGIAWDTLTCINQFVSSFYQPLSDMTNGVCLPFKSSDKTQDLIKTVSYARGGTKMSDDAFVDSYMSAASLGDLELTGSYKSLTSLMSEDVKRRVATIDEATKSTKIKK